MITTFIATIAFSIGLLAFCAGSWLTIWASTNSKATDVAAAKLTGYFVTVLSLIALVFTSYYITLGVVTSQTIRQPITVSKSNMNKHKTGNTNTNSNTSR